MGFCLKVMRMLEDLLSGALSPKEVRQVREHLKSCSNCRLVLRSAERTLQTYFTAPDRRRTAA